MSFERVCYRDYVLELDSPQFSEKIVPSKIVEHAALSYAVYHYDTDILCFDDHFHGQFRSVVFSHPENRLLSFSPPKSAVNERFMEETPFLDDEHVTVSEKVEGVMINLFYEKRNGRWTLATKTTVGGNRWVFEPKNDPAYVGNRKPNPEKSSFLAMFLDALQCSQHDLNDCAIMNELDTQYSYSFVLQHPDNTITRRVERPRVYLVAVYDIDQQHNRAVEIPSYVYENWPIFLNVGIIEFPTKITESSYDTIRKKYCAKHSSYVGPGIVVHNYAKGMRTVFENEAYGELRNAYKINTMLLYQYLSLHRIDKIADFMKYFHPYRKQMEEFRRTFDDFIKCLHQAYLDVHVLKIIRVADLNHSIAPHVKSLHKNIYLRFIGTRLAKRITREVVREYVEAMEPREMLYLMTHHRRTATAGQ
jgi:hypothetical protein